MGIARLMTVGCNLSFHVSQTQKIKIDVLEL